MDDIPLKPENFRILHPEIIRRTGQVLERYALTQGKVSGRQFPSARDQVWHRSLFIQSVIRR